MIKTALVCIAKNEENYIEEWLIYHQKLGFDQIFIYQNNWRTKVKLANVTKIEFDGDQKQLESYNHFLKTYGCNYDWAAFFDVDEFLVLKKHSNINDFIADYADHDGIGINWVYFGDNGLLEPTDEYSLLKRFTMRQKVANDHVKSIVKIKACNKMFVHHPDYEIVDTDFKKFYGTFNGKRLDNVAQINHYFCKTKKEFLEKIERGRADTNCAREISEFDTSNFNEVEDLTAYNFFMVSEDATDNIVPVVTCVNMSDFLHVSLKHNRRFFKDYIVLTSPEDFKTKRLCELNNVRVIEFSSFFKDGARFNKSGGINWAQKIVHGEYKNSWILLMDADIVLNRDFLDVTKDIKLDMEEELKPKYSRMTPSSSRRRKDSSILYGIDRYDISKNDDLFKKSLPISQKYEVEHAGYFQLYYNKLKYYPIFSENASLCDMEFLDLFSCKKMLDSCVFHLGEKELHWNGRNCSEWK